MVSPLKSYIRKVLELSETSKWTIEIVVGKIIRCDLWSKTRWAGEDVSVPAETKSSELNSVKIIHMANPLVGENSD